MCNNPCLTDSKYELVEGKTKGMKRFKLFVRETQKKGRVFYRNYKQKKWTTPTKYGPFMRVIYKGHTDYSFYISKNIVQLCQIKPETSLGITKRGLTLNYYCRGFNE